MSEKLTTLFLSQDELSILACMFDLTEYVLRQHSPKDDDHSCENIPCSLNDVKKVKQAIEIQSRGNLSFSDMVLSFRSREL